MLETIKKWEQEAKIEDLNLVTEKLGIDKQKYKEVSLQLNDIITLRTKLQGSQHLDTIYANGILAAVYRVIGKHKSAANIIQQCLSIIESMLLGNDEIPKDFTKKDLLFLYAACVEEFGRIFLAFEKAELALESVQHGISVIESQMDPQSVDDFKVHLAVLHKVLAEIQFSLGRLEEARDSISKSDKVIGKIGNDLVWRYRLLNHWQGKSANKFRNCLLGAKIHSRLMDFSGAEKYLEDAWTIAAKDTGRMSIECCNAYIELVDFYAKLIPSEISAEDFVRLLAQGLTVTRATDSVLRKTRGVDKRIIFPYYPMIQRGLRTLLTVDERKDISIALLFECLRIHEKYPSIYPTTNDDIFRKVMTLVQLLREEREYTRALDLVTKYKEKFKSLKTKEVGAVISLIEIQAQLIISVCYGDEPPVPNTSSGRVPLSQQMAITTQTRDAVEGLEYVVTYYSKNKNTEATIKSLHTLAIVETLQEEFSYADRECHRCIKLIDPSFVEYEDYIELAESKIAPHHFGRLSDLFILRGTILRVQHDPKRALNHYKVALKLLSTPRSEKNLRLQDEITRTYDMLRCLGFMIDISKSTLSEHEEVNDTEKIAETKEFLKVCKANYNTVSAELDKLKGVQKPRSHSL